MWRSQGSLLFAALDLRLLRHSNPRCPCLFQDLLCSRTSGIRRPWKKPFTCRWLAWMLPCQVSPSPFNRVASFLNFNLCPPSSLQNPWTPRYARSLSISAFNRRTNRNYFSHIIIQIIIDFHSLDCSNISQIFFLSRIIYLTYAYLCIGIFIKSVH
jgi:hypothetical protein